MTEQPDDYGVTLAQATADEDLALVEIAAARKAGELEAFTGEIGSPRSPNESAERRRFQSARSRAR